MSRRPPRSTLTATLVPDTTLFRSDKRDQGLAVGGLEFGETGVDAVHCASPSPSRGRPGWGWVCCGWEETHTLPSPPRSEEHTSELQSLMRNSHAVFCLKKQTNNPTAPLITSNQLPNECEHDN